MGATSRLCRGLLLCCALVTTRASPAQDSAPPPAVPRDAIASILATFATHDFVALGVHGYEEEYELWLTLLHTPEFQGSVDDIVVEFGSARYQEVMDRFTRGAEVPYDELKNVWQQTTQPHHVADAPIYENFFRAVREINATLPNDDQLRVVLAEPPIDWALIEDFEDLLPWLQRRFPYEAEVVEREVLTRGRKALLISGTGHYLNGTPLLNAIRAHGKEAFKIWTTTDVDIADLQPSTRSWTTPSLALVAGTVLGSADIHGFYGAGTAPPGPLEEQFDAVLYLGPPSNLTKAQIASELCFDRAYLDMRLPRLELAAANGASAWLDDFRSFCEQARAND
jgi:hypothetical protein